MWNNIRKNDYFRKKYSAVAMKKKKSIISRTARSVLIIAAVPIIILWIAIIALYLPPVQRYATDMLCRKISERTCCRSLRKCNRCISRMPLKSC